ncbi:MAG TPA: glycoside hydrolase family 3 N-terminal domain-containing protein [Thermoleophilaceae bacterium]|nr:glycoside hydrolase family 3 N-terminal domain-containing protein [Thermoleophilaceae bacterium]
MRLPLRGDAAQAGAARLPLRVQVGQLIVSSFGGARLPEYLRRRLRRRQTAGVILFRRNVSSRPGLRRLSRRIQGATGRGALVMTDQEGGPVRNLVFAGPVPSQPRQGSPRRVGRLAAGAARQLRAAGVNVALAPVADLAAGHAMRFRAFAGASGAVAARVGASVQGWRRGRVGATAKHFPGFGAAAVNSDLRPVTIRLSRRRLERHLRPFRSAIAGGVPLIMAAHALYPAYSLRRIASQSRELLTHLLRDRLGYEGVVITDSIEAKAVVRRSSVPLAAERSIAAGADLVLTTGSASWKLVFPRLLRRARRSPAFRTRVRESAARVLRLKRRLGLRAPG